MTPATKVDAALTRVRALCLALPGVTERPSHGAPTFFAAKRAFVMFMNDHHGDGRLALWCKAPPGAQGLLVDSDADRFFVPPYVGPKGWVGVRLDRPKTDWTAVAAIIEDAHAVAAPPKPRRIAKTKRNAD
jgi:hypothetical protein